MILAPPSKATCTPTQLRLLPSGRTGKISVFWCRATCSNWVLIFLSWCLHIRLPLPDQHHSFFSSWKGPLITLGPLTSSLAGQDPFSVSPSLRSRTPVLYDFRAQGMRLVGARDGVGIGPFLPPPFPRLALLQISTRCVLETLALEEKWNFLNCHQH